MKKLYKKEIFMNGKWIKNDLKCLAVCTWVACMAENKVDVNVKHDSTRTSYILGFY